MLGSTAKTAREIRSLRIQGAEAIASAAVEAMAAEAHASKAKTKAALLKELGQAANILKQARPTEPALRNSLRFILARGRQSDAAVPELKRFIVILARDYAKHSLLNKKKIAGHGGPLVPNNGAVLLHCHSSSVMRVLKKAHDDGKKFKVYCLETRPLYQGRTSAAELSNYGIDAVLCVDSCAETALLKMGRRGIVLVGADAVTADGDLVNKIGTAGVAALAYGYGTRLYSCTGSHKFDPLTLGGKSEPIEERAAEEVLTTADAAKWGFKRMPRVLNPAFDLTPASLVTGFVTEWGVQSPKAFVKRATAEYR
ncbi:hypothetical protein COX86_01540 [Candidatus Micrarchaeota archaeon CG_4_10_14_0_2_um_filter_60_11]|nr:MAG: hypothetical protein AUJ16_02065 [Candidatus Micrarchaeota archaeon CG1_02_60_51]PIN95959.1 MAG: hypothetical protein COU39_03265 [Candidatus Micrarchaeota archaeon CG10_big_fil_rev_8_21_14_0_10_60_32]PIO02290.1 MAG: hypothetical protein COT58_00880 [Candidatus Micrarchaeota archaeon CG09_land_8_20_14_0_10_60_16]PIY91164.1 MAG: hypothetical protein COY71_04630 [Candidatus Micrarchaeota archaeon CG_4_10_14_0_8_um_filter_60_7]PIZ91081.1 MAG: hypothetical protein COX86_01540 [Candidatus Mi